MAKKDSAKTEAQIPDIVLSASAGAEEIKQEQIAEPAVVQPRTEEVKEEPVEVDVIPAEKSNNKLFIVGGLLLILLIALTAVLYYFIIQQKGSGLKVANPEVKEKKVEVTPKAPVVKFKRAEWSFEVLNGTSTAGAAKKAADSLEALGYKIDKVGNSEEDFTAGQLLIAKDKKAPEELLADVKKLFNISSVSGKLSDSTSGARIILGNDSIKE